MKILLAILLLLLPFKSFAFDDYLLMQAMPKFPAGMTFLAIYNDGILDADRSGGSPTSIFSASRGANNPATFFDSSEVMQITTTSNAGRFTHGFYDTTGFNLYTHASLWAEKASTNLFSDSYFSEDIATYWQHNGTSIENSTDVPAIFGDNVCKFVFNNGNVLTETIAHRINIFNGEDVTVSIWLRGSGTVKIRITVDGNIESGDITLDSTWKRHIFSHTVSTGGGTSKEVLIVGVGSGIVYSDCWQVEKNRFATSYIPTTTAALTRNLESNKYETAGNRTKAVETCVIKFAPEFTGSSAGENNYRLLSTDTKDRSLVDGFDGDFRFKPNADDSSASSTGFIDTITTINTEVTVGVDCQHSSPFAQLYKNGVDQNRDETADDFTNPNWGTYFWVGSSNSGTDQLNAPILGVAFFDRVLTPDEHLFMHEKDWRTLR